MFVVLASLSLFTPSVPLSQGKALIFGKGGPPVVFSSGLFGTMTHRIYGDLIRGLTARNLSIVVPSSMAPVTRSVVEDVADALGAEEVGFFSHSSFDVDVLSSDVVKRAVLCDPIVVPKFGIGSFFSSPLVEREDLSILSLRAGTAYDEAVRESAPIPDYLSPTVPKDTSVVFDGMGHADVLDDYWAAMGPRMLPWMRPSSTPKKSFLDWAGPASASSAPKRSAYRDEVAERASSFFLSEGGETVADGGLVRAEDAASD